MASSLAARLATWSSRQKLRAASPAPWHYHQSAGASHDPQAEASFLGCREDQERLLAGLEHKSAVPHLVSCGVRFKASRFQTDNGAEFVGNWQAKRDSGFTQAVESVWGLRHTTCPVRAHTWQADVETVHRIIEDEFYEVEEFSSRADFLSKAGAYNLWFNVGRRNSGKENKTPWEIIHEKEPTVSAAICALPPVYLDELFMKKLDAKLLWGYDLIPHPSLGLTC